MFLLLQYVGLADYVSFVEPHLQRPGDTGRLHQRKTVPTMGVAMMVAALMHLTAVTEAELP